MESLGEFIPKDVIEKTMPLKVSTLRYYQLADRIFFSKQSLSHFFFIEGIKPVINGINIFWNSHPENLGSKEMPNCIKTIINEHMISVQVIIQF